MLSRLERINVSKCTLLVLVEWILFFLISFRKNSEMLFMGLRTEIVILTFILSFSLVLICFWERMGVTLSSHSFKLMASGDGVVIFLSGCISV